MLCALHRLALLPMHDMHPLKMRHVVVAVRSACDIAARLRALTTTEPSHAQLGIKALRDMEASKGKVSQSDPVFTSTPNPWSSHIILEAESLRHQGLDGF